MFTSIFPRSGTIATDAATTTFYSLLSTQYTYANFSV